MRDAIKTKMVAINYIPTNKMIADPLTNSIPQDAFKVHILSLGLRVVYCLDVSCYLTKTFCNEH